MKLSSFLPKSKKTFLFFVLSLLLTLPVLSQNLRSTNIDNGNPVRGRRTSTEITPGRRGTSGDTRTARLRSDAVESYAMPVSASIRPTIPSTTSYTFASFDPGGFTGGGAAYTHSLNVSSLPSSEYLFVNVTADYAPGAAAPHDGWSSTMQMELNNGGSTIYWGSSTATYGVLPAGGSTTLRWV